jgi:hypothetical protein
MHHPSPLWKRREGIAPSCSMRKAFFLGTYLTRHRGKLPLARAKPIHCVKESDNALKMELLKITSGIK